MLRTRTRGATASGASAGSILRCTNGNDARLARASAAAPATGTHNNTTSSTPYDAYIIIISIIRTRKVGRACAPQSIVAVDDGVRAEGRGRRVARTAARGARLEPRLAADDPIDLGMQ